jgi:hypothetical protein
MTSGWTTSSNLPSALRDKLSGSNNVAGVSFGLGGSWAVWWQDRGWLADEIRDNGSGVKVSVTFMIILTGDFKINLRTSSSAPGAGIITGWKCGMDRYTIVYPAIERPTLIIESSKLDGGQDFL